MGAYSELEVSSIIGLNGLDDNDVQIPSARINFFETLSPSFDN